MNHYTMSLWSSNEEMVAFSRSGAHLDAMKYSFRKKISKANKFITIDATELLDWTSAKKLLKEKGRSVNA